MKNIDKIIDLAIEEDIGDGDLTTNCLVSNEASISGKFIAKEAGVIAGLPFVERIFSRFEDMASLEFYVKEGQLIKTGDLIAGISGNARTILTYERLALNFLQRLSGIATLTAQYVKHAEKQGVMIVDTRKTTPGLRYMEKYAVKTGGGENHRMGLYDQVLIKDNHLNLLNRGKTGYSKAITSIRKEIPSNTLIEIEVDQVENVNEALEAGADIIMFDNMKASQITKSLNIVKEWQLKTGGKRPLIEVSGNVTLDNIDDIIQPGIDRIAIGAITHSAKALDISLQFDD